MDRRDRENNSRDRKEAKSVYSQVNDTPAWLNVNELKGKYYDYNKDKPSYTKLKVNDRYSKYELGNGDDKPGKRHGDDLDGGEKRLRTDDNSDETEINPESAALQGSEDTATPQPYKSLSNSTAEPYRPISDRREPESYKPLSRKPTETYKSLNDRRSDVAEPYKSLNDRRSDKSDFSAPNSHNPGPAPYRPIHDSSILDTYRSLRPEESEPYRPIGGNQPENDRDDNNDDNNTPEEITPAPYSKIDFGESTPQYQTFKSKIANKHERDTNSLVRLHYNQRTKVSKYQGARSNSPIYKLRNFNNIIKYILLGNNVKKLSRNEPLTILDLCCGKGGDLNKCEFIEADQYIGIDISDISVAEGFKRYNQQKARFKPHNSNVRDSRRYNFEACFATGDCFTKSVPEILEPNFPGIIDNLFPVDCVSIQFAFHYSFETEEKVRMLLTNVSRSLRPGGKFIGTMPSSDFIKEKILKKDFLVNDSNDKVKFGNEIYSVTFENKPPIDGIFRPPYGNKYNYFLQDAVDNVPEFVVPFETLRGLCEEFGMTLKYKKNFLDIYNEEIPKYFQRLSKHITNGIKRSDGKYGVEGVEKEASAFYLGFVFEKLP